MVDQLWAPWRYEYVTQAGGGPKIEGCLFEELAGRTEDRENLVLHRGRTAFVLLNRYPYTSGHLMAAPYRHTGDMAELNDEELLEINQLVALATRWLREAYQPDAFNIGVNMGRAAGAGIPGHIHWHIVPRWSGDTNFMTSVAQVRVIPQSLESAYDLLKSIVDRG